MIPPRPISVGRRPLARPAQPASARGGTGVDTQELIANGTFGSSTGWALGTGWSVAGGVLVATAVAAAGSPAASTTYAQTPLAQGAFYNVTYTISGFSAGSVRFQFTGGATVNGTARGANGTLTETVLATAPHTGFQFIAATDFTGNIDNLSVRRVG